jgi:hypothetical protein
MLPLTLTGTGRGTGTGALRIQRDNPQSGSYIDWTFYGTGLEILEGCLSLSVSNRQTFPMLRTPFHFLLFLSAVHAKERYVQYVLFYMQ